VNVYDAVIQPMTELKELEKWKEKGRFERFESPWRDPCSGRDPTLGTAAVGAEAGEFLGVRNTFARISPSLPKISRTQIMKTFF